MPATRPLLRAALRLADSAEGDARADLLDALADVASALAAPPAAGLGDPEDEATFQARRRVRGYLKDHLARLAESGALLESHDAEPDAALMEAGKTGVFKDRNQKTYCLKDGRRAPCGSLSPDELKRGAVKDYQPPAAPAKRPGKAAGGTSGKEGQPAPAKPKPAPKKPATKPQKLTPDEAKARVQSMLASGKTSPQDAADLAQHLLSLTVPQLNALKQELGLKASGKKAELAGKIAERALQKAGAAAPQAEPDAGPAPEPDAPKGPHPGGIAGALADAGEGVPVPMADLRAASGLGKKEFDAEVMRLADEGKLYLTRHNAARHLPPEKREQLVFDGEDYFGYAAMPHGQGGEAPPGAGGGAPEPQPGPAPEPEPAPPADAPAKPEAPGGAAPGDPGEALSGLLAGAPPQLGASLRRKAGDASLPMRERLEALGQLDTEVFDGLYRMGVANEHFTHNEYFRRLATQFGNFERDMRRPAGARSAPREFARNMEKTAARFGEAARGLRALAAKGVRAIEGRPADLDALADFYEKGAGLAKALGKAAAEGG